MEELKTEIIRRFKEIGKPLFYSDIYEPLRDQGYSSRELFRVWQELISSEIITADENFCFCLKEKSELKINSKSKV